jgi:hypothetical protein
MIALVADVCDVERGGAIKLLLDLQVVLGDRAVLVVGLD